MTESASQSYLAGAPAPVPGRPRPALRHLAAWLAFFGSFLLLAVVPLLPPRVGEELVVPPGILDDPDMLVVAVAGTWFSFAIAAILAWAAKLTPRELGFVGLPWRRLVGWTLLLVALLFGSVALAEAVLGDKLQIVEPLTRRPGDLGHWLLWLGLAASAGFCEEFFARGYGIGLLRRFGVPGWAGLAVTSVLFGTLHLYEGPHAVGIIALWGFLFGLSFLRTGSLLPAMLAHFLVNAVAPLLLPG